MTAPNPARTTTEIAAAVFASPLIDIRDGVPLPHIALPEKKKRRTRHYKAELANALAWNERQSRVALEALEREDTANLKVECIKHAADLEAAGLRKRIRFWRAVALPAWTVLVLGVLARMVL